MALGRREEELIYRLAEKLTGSCQEGVYRKEILAGNIERRMRATGAPNLGSYLRLVRDDSAEYERMISELTIHTTSWFRETPHFSIVRKHLEENLKEPRTLKIWSAACSTGEEIYSLALSLRDLFARPHGLAFHASDIDPVSVRTAERAVYDVHDMRGIPRELHGYLLVGGGKAKGLFTLEKEIRGRCRVFVNDLTAPDFTSADGDYDVIFCRNVLIYFKPDGQREIVTKLARRLRPGGILVLGHSESVDVAGMGLTPGLHSVFKKHAQQRAKIAPKSKPRLLAVDDSATMRQALLRLFGAKFDLALADSPVAATRMIRERAFDLISLDLNMPGENGLAWLNRMRAEGMRTPVVILSESDQASAEKLFGASVLQAQDYLNKSRINQDPEAVCELFESLAAHSGPSVEGAFEVRPFFVKSFKPCVIAIGASTGGPEALAKLLASFPKPCPPIVIVQHMAAEFARAFGQRLSSISGLPLADFKGETELLRGQLHVATGDLHLEIRRHGEKLMLSERDSAKENGHRPSVNRLFRSLARAGADSIAVMLTGMGEDGAEAMLELAENGRCFTMAQDQESSVVYGMNRRAVELKAACFVGSLESLRHELAKRMKGWG